jgi:hypothetical protein
MNGTKIASLAAAGTLITAGCASAATASPAVTAGRATGVSAAAGTGPAGHTVKGPAHIIAYSINSDGPHLRAILTRAVGDYGPAVTVHPNGTLDPEHTSDLQLNLTHGSFRLSIAALDKDIVKAYQHWPHSQATCSGSITVSAPTPVVARSGTGAYRGISGSFKMTATIDLLQDDSHHRPG